MSAPQVEAVLLGVAQDGGVPQVGCLCDHCQRAHVDPAQRQLVVCLGLIDHTAHQTWLIDATPDFREQLHALRQIAPGYACAGILLTHAHVGHYTGLIHLGREAWNTAALPVYASPTMCGFLRAHAPWSQLVDLGNIALQELELDRPLALSPDLHVTPVPAPHRNEWSDTLAFVVRGAQRALFYCPDTDGWDAWGPPLSHTLQEVEVALLDGCFFSTDEIPGRNLEEIPHPTVVNSVTWLSTSRHECAIYFIHLNHTNPLYQAGAERTWLIQQGYNIGQVGQQWLL